MAQIPTPPASPPSEALRKASPEDNSSPENLDALLERYLHLLDRHQQLQAELGKQLSSGFFSLTQANYSCPPGRRYGEDYYDERMKAIRTISIDSNPSTNHKPSTNSDTPGDEDVDLSTLLSFRTLSLSDSSTKHPITKQEQAATDSNSNPEPSSPSSAEEDKPLEQNPEPQPEVNTAQESEEEETEETEENKETDEEPKPPRNPLSWFGILVPPPLRSAQTSFTSAVEGPIPSLAAVMIEMRDVERRVEDARSRLRCT